MVKLTGTETLIEKIAWHYDAPFGDTAILPMYIAGKRVGNGGLTSGGDEVLGSYRVHQSEKFINYGQLFSNYLRESILRIISKFLAIIDTKGNERIRQARRVLNTANMDFVSRIESKQVGFTLDERRLLLGNNKRVRPALEFIQDAILPAKTQDNSGLLSYWLYTVSLQERMFRKVDRCSMAQLIETRTPFLDYRTIELLANVSTKVKMPGFTRKHIPRQTIA